MPDRTKHETLPEREFINLLSEIENPARYIGGEYGSVTKPSDSVKCRICLAFPDAYEIGMSYLGFRILYSILNQDEHIAAERVFSPWPDFEKRLKEYEVPLFSLESRSPLRTFDFIGFSLQYELSFTNILTILDLADIPLRSADRAPDDPIIIAGGPVAFNPEPISPFIDLFFIGDAEEGFPQIAQEYISLKEKSKTRNEILLELSSIDSVYVPKFTKTEMNIETGRLFRLDAQGGKPFKVKKRILNDFSSHPFPSELVVPFGKSVQDRVSIELLRGCGRGCRFCQAGYIYLPERERPVEQVEKTILDSLRSTGYDEVSLTGLTPTDYSGLCELVLNLDDKLTGNPTSLSISSMRVGGVDPAVMEVISGVRRTGFTIAPEAGSQRMRDVINKNLTEDDILKGARALFEGGWQLIKLYFMIGLPTETEEDIIAIATLANKVLSQARGTGVRPEINMAISSFVPKPHTPFQWEEMDGIDTLREKVNLIRKNIHSRRIKLKYHSYELSYLEGIFSRGDCALADIIEEAWKDGARFDGWSDFRNFHIWKSALDHHEIKAENYFRETEPEDERLPWSHIDAGVKQEYLRKERGKALGAETSPGCPSVKCSRCGVCGPNVTKVPLSDPSINKEPNSRETKTEVKEKEVSLQPQKCRYAAFYTKSGVYRYLANFDIVRTMTRALRRAGVEFLYSQGFHPKPKMSFPPPLSVGIEGEKEFFDFILKEKIETKELLNKVNLSLPEGLRILSIDELISNEPLSLSVKGAVFSVKLKDGLAIEEIRNYHDVWEKLWNSSQPIKYIDKRKKGTKEKDLRLLINFVKLDEEQRKLRFSLLYRSQGSINPKEFLNNYFKEISNIQEITRDRLIFS